LQPPCPTGTMPRRHTHRESPREKLIQALPPSLESRKRESPITSYASSITDQHSHLSLVCTLRSTRTRILCRSACLGRLCTSGWSFIKLYSLCSATHLPSFFRFRGKSAPPIRVIGGGKTSVFRDNIRWAYTPYVAVPPPATGLRPLRKEKSPAKDDMCWLRISSIQLRHPGIRYPDRTYPQQSLPQWLGC